MSSSSIELVVVLILSIVLSILFIKIVKRIKRSRNDFPNYTLSIGLVLALSFVGQETMNVAYNTLLLFEVDATTEFFTVANLTLAFLCSLTVITILVIELVLFTIVHLKDKKDLSKENLSRVVLAVIGLVIIMSSNVVTTAVGVVALTSWVFKLSVNSIARQLKY